MSDFKKKAITTYQIMTYVFLSFKVGIFSAIIMPSFKLGFQILFALIYYTGLFPLAYLGYKHTVIDLTDPIVKLERRAKIENLPFDSDQYEYHCPYCETSVSENAKHCRECNKCVKDFDHHCKWVNNCISKSNYKTFIAMLVFVFLTTAVFCTAATIYIIDVYTAKANVVDFEGVMDVKTDKVAKIAVILAADSLAAIFAFLDLKLLWFHMFLIRMKLTTYDYIMQKRNSSPKKLKKEKNKVFPDKPPPTGKIETEANMIQPYVTQITGHSETKHTEPSEKKPLENIREQISKQVALEFPTDTSAFDTKSPVNEPVHTIEDSPPKHTRINSKSYGEQIPLSPAQESQRGPENYDRIDPAGETRESLLHPNKRSNITDTPEILTNQKSQLGKSNSHLKIERSKL